LADHFSDAGAALNRPVQAYCARCEKLFCYFRDHARRLYCSPYCVENERLDLLAFTRTQRRKTAVARARLEQTARHFSRFPDGGLAFDRGAA
jgi:hypothetical protein